jgi:DNA mismatch repair protein MutS2
MERIIREIRTSRAERGVIRRSHERIRRRGEDIRRSAASKEARQRIDPADIVAGGWVHIVSLGKPGRVLRVENGSRVTLELQGGLRVETRVEDLAPRDRPGPKDTAARVTWTTEEYETITGELMVRGLDRAEALERVDAFLDRAVLQGLRTVTIIHGIGKLVLKDAIYGMLASDPRVEDVHPGKPEHGGDGVAVVELK